MSTNFNIENNKKLKENPFQVPADYFEKLNRKLEKSATESSKVIELKKGLATRKYLSLAATLLLLISATWYFWPQAELSQAELTSEEIESLVNYGFVQNADLVFLEISSTEELNEIDLNNEDYIDYYETTQPQLIEDYYIYNENI